jgi:hypothetical protein
MTAAFIIDGPLSIEELDELHATAPDGSLERSDPRDRGGDDVPAHRPHPIGILAVAEKTKHL